MAFGDEYRSSMSFEEYEKEMAKPVPELTDPKAKTMDELNEWAKEYGCMNIIYWRNYSRLQGNKV